MQKNADGGVTIYVDREARFVALSQSFSVGTNTRKEVCN